jgi:hypothetical protein
MKAFVHGRIVESEPHEVCAVYDRRDGRIVHVHEIVRWPGSPASSKQALVKRGLEIAAKMGHKVSKLRALRLDPMAFDRGKRYHIDPKSKRLIEIERPPSLLQAGLQVPRKLKTRPEKTATPRNRNRERTKR